jgi:hypothetical protein
MRYNCEKCGKWVKDKFIFGTLHYCFPLLEGYRIENRIFEVKQLNEVDDELEHIAYVQ